jgi:hypothetical protein
MQAEMVMDEEKEIPATTEGTDTTAELISAFDGLWQHTPDEDEDDVEDADVDIAGELDAAAETTGEVEEDDGDLPAVTESGKGIKQLREAYKKQKSEAAELRRELEQLRTAKTLDTSQQEARERQKPAKSPAHDFAEKFSTEDILTFLGRYEAGEAEGDDESLAKLRGQALDALELKTPQEVLEVKRKAQRGEYGSVSRDVEAVAAEALATLQVVAENNRAEASRLTQWQSERKQALDTAFAEAKVRLREDGNIDDSTEEGKRFIADGNELLGLIPSLVNDARAPMIVSQYTQMKAKAIAHDALAKENEALKARLRRFGGSLPATGKSSKPSASNPRDALHEAFRSAGFDL